MEVTYPYTKYFWMIPDERKAGKMRKTRYRMTEADALAQHPGAVRIDADAMVIDGPSSSASHLAE